MSSHSSIETQYQDAIAALTPAQRVARSEAMFAWTRDQIGRQIISEEGEMDFETLKWKVGLRLYGNEPTIRQIIERKLSDVSD